MPMTKQEFFDEAMRLLREQGEPSFDRLGGTCYYRHPTKPLKCGIGFFITDEEYDPKIEGQPYDYGHITCAALKHLDDVMLSSFQSDVHDNAASAVRSDPSVNFLEELERGAKIFAKNWSLAYAQD